MSNSIVVHGALSWHAEGGGRTHLFSSIGGVDEGRITGARIEKIEQNKGRRAKAGTKGLQSGTELKEKTVTSRSSAMLCRAFRYCRV
jgi:hypothetical protein